MIADLLEKFKRLLSRFTSPDEGKTGDANDERFERVSRVEDEAPQDRSEFVKLEPATPSAPVQPPPILENQPSPEVDISEAEGTNRFHSMPDIVVSDVGQRIPPRDAPPEEPSEFQKRTASRAAIRQAQKSGRNDEAMRLANEERFRRWQQREFDDSGDFPDISPMGEPPQEPSPRPVQRRPGLHQAAQRAAAMGDAAVQEMRQEQRPPSANVAENEQIAVFREMLAVLKNIEGKLDLTSRWQ